MPVTLSDFCVGVSGPERISQIFPNCIFPNCIFILQIVFYTKLYFFNPYFSKLYFSKLYSSKLFLFKTVFSKLYLFQTVFSKLHYSKLYYFKLYSNCVPSLSNPHLLRFGSLFYLWCDVIDFLTAHLSTLSVGGGGGVLRSITRVLHFLRLLQVNHPLPTPL